jgi:hypothetical protein
MDTLTIVSTVALAVYDLTGIILIAWAIYTLCKLKGRR